MRIPNLNVSGNITNTIRELDQERFKLDRQISTGQKITYPEDDGIRTGRLIQVDALKAKLSQYQRNASYASEFLNSGHMNLDQLHKVNQRAQEIARVAGSQINRSAAETYGHEIEQLVEEALNRINSKHRGRSLFGGTEHKENFGNTDVQLGLERKKIISLNKAMVGDDGLSGGRELKASESIVLQLNGREYVVQATVDGLSTSEVAELVKDLINEDQGILADSPAFPNPPDPNAGYKAYVRNGSSPNDFRNDDAKLYAKISTSGDLEVFGTVGEDYNASALFVTTWDPNLYFPEQVDKKIAAQTEFQFPGRSFDSLTDAEKDSVRREVFQTGSSSFNQSQFELMLDSNAVTSFQQEYATRNPIVSLTKFDDLDAAHQNEIFESTYRDFFNSGQLVFELTDDQVKDLTEQDGKGGYYAFDYQKTGDKTFEGINTGETSFGYLKAMEQDSDGLWRASPYAESSNLAITDTDNFYQQIRRNAETIFKFDTQKVDEYVVGNQWIPVGAAPVTNWERELDITATTSKGTSSFETIHSRHWKRLEVFDLGSTVEFDGKIWESQIANNFNHKPSTDNSLYWKELPSDYSVEREDWKLEVVGTKQRFFHMAPDGQMFEEYEDAINYTGNLLLSSTNGLEPTVNGLDEIFGQNGAAQNLVKEVKYAVTDYDVQGSVSNAIATFDPKTLQYTLSAAKLGGDVIDAPYLKGEISRYSDDFQPVEENVGSVFSYEGNYYLITDHINFDRDSIEDLNQIDRSGGGVFFLGKNLPAEAKELIFQDDDTISGKKGDYIFREGLDPNGNLVPEYFVAVEDFTGETNLDENIIFERVNAYTTRQGAEWSSSSFYDQGQVVFHKGKYYQCQVSDFNNRVNTLDETTNATVQTIVQPDDKFITQLPITQAINAESANETVANYTWLPLGDSLDHVFKFKTTHQESPEVSIFPAGSSGENASAEAILDADGDVVGLKLLEPGRYFFGFDESGAIPPDFQEATISLTDGTQVKAKIIWEENPSDPGPYRISGFELIDDGNLSGHRAQNSPRLGDTFSFATGSKTFLDHRDEDGKLLGVTYQGGDKNAVTRVGKDTDVSYMLDASNGKTAALGEVVNSLVELRDGLFETAQSTAPSTVPETEKNLLSLEDLIIDNMGELSATMVRMEMVRNHDEEYVMALDKQIAKDIEVDISEAIMRLTQVSTSYQAAMQVGAQLLNSSLLNYL